MTFHDSVLKYDFYHRIDRETRGARSSPVRVVTCRVKPRKERTPYVFLLTGEADHSVRTAADKMEEGADDAKSS